MTDPTLPAIPSPANIVKLTSNTLRVAVNYNPTPIFDDRNPGFDSTGGVEPDAKGNYALLRTPDAPQYAKSLGLETYFPVYNGTENRALLWHDGTDFRTLKADANRWDFDWSLEANHSDPLNPVAARAIAALAMQPDRFGAKLDCEQPVVLDIERSAAYNGPVDTPEQATGQIQNWTTRLQTYRGLLSPDRELYAYFQTGYAHLSESWGARFTQDLAAADRQMMQLLSGMMLSFYNWDLSITAPGSWYAAVDRATSDIGAYYPFHARNKWAVVTPTYQVYWGNLPKTKGRNGELVPLDVWKRQLRYLADRGWHLGLWLPGALKGIKGHLDEAARFAA